MSQEKIERWDAVKGNDAPQDMMNLTQEHRLEMQRQ